MITNLGFKPYAQMLLNEMFHRFAFIISLWLFETYFSLKRYSYSNTSNSSIMNYVNSNL